MSVDTNYRAGIKLLLKSEWSTFAATFSRFEYALKQAAYLKYEKPGTSAEAGWEGFAGDLGAEFHAHCQSQSELRVLFDAPPRLLKVDKDRSVAWKKSRAVNTAADFFQVIKDIRNNLFHGDTNVHGDRDGQLIAAAQIALDLAWRAASLNPGNPCLVKFVESFGFQP